MLSNTSFHQEAIHRHLPDHPSHSLSTSSPFHPAYTMSRTSTSSSQPRSLRQIQERSQEADGGSRNSSRRGSRRDSTISLDPWGPLEDEWDESPHFRHGTPGWNFPPRSSTASSFSLSQRQASVLSLGTRMRLSSPDPSSGERRSSYAGVEMRRRSSQSSRSLVGIGFGTCKRRKSSGLHSLQASHRLGSSSGSGSESLRSYGSSFDAIDERALQLQRLGMLQRRYSDIVRTIGESDEEDEDEDEEADLSRRSNLREMLSRWSISSGDHYHYEGDDTDGEDLSSPSTPSSPSLPASPSSPPTSSPAPTANLPINTLSTLSVSSNLGPFSVPDTASSSYVLGRPSLQRSLTDYSFPPRTAPALDLASTPIAPRCNVQRPLYDGPGPGPHAYIPVTTSASAGAFPMARITPLGASPLRESARRQSVWSTASEDEGEEEEDGGPTQRGPMKVPALFPRQEQGQGQGVWRVNAPHAIPLPANPYRFPIPPTSICPSLSNSSAATPSTSLSASLSSCNTNETPYESLITPRAVPVMAGMGYLRDRPTTDERLAAEAAAGTEGYPFHAVAPSPVPSSAPKAAATAALERKSIPSSPSILNIHPHVGGHSVRRTLSVTFADEISLGMTGQKRGSCGSGVSVYSATSSQIRSRSQSRSQSRSRSESRSRRGSMMNEALALAQQAQSANVIEQRRKASSSSLTLFLKLAAGGGRGKESGERGSGQERRGLRRRSDSADAMWEGLGLDTRRRKV
ncbi:hypothetical protein IAR50_002404 [Cryptococcus sp. DSM 104548]